MLSWNIEGVSRNLFNLKHFIDIHQPDFIFLSEPQIFSCNIDLVLQPVAWAYEYSLSSEDKIDPELPMTKSKASGGTLALWKKKFDPFIEIHPFISPSFTSFLFHPPGSIPTIHFAVYLPTHGKEE